MAPVDLIKAVLYTVSWMTASSGLILLNKYLLSNLDFHYPLTLSRCAARAGRAGGGGAVHAVSLICPPYIR
jgi:hypothetical protein